jgi:hypothetical protein
MRERLREPIETALDEAGDVVDSQVVRLRDIGDQLADENLSALSAAVAGVAGGVEGLGSRLESVDVDRVIDFSQETARRRGPWMFMAGGAIFGLAVWATLRRGGSDDDEQDERGELDAGGAAADEE